MRTDVVVLVGMPGAGKSTCVDHLISKGFSSVYFGGIVVEETIKRYGKATEEHEKIVREEFRELDGKGAIAKRIIPKIDALLKKNKKVIADGLYSWTEYKMFKEHYGERAVIIAVAAPRKIRHERLRLRPVRPFTREQVIAREYAEIENIEKGGPIANADYTIVNYTEDPNDMLRLLDDVLHDIGFYEKQ